MVGLKTFPVSPDGGGGSWRLAAGHGALRECREVALLQQRWRDGEEEGGRRRAAAEGNLSGRGVQGEVLKPCDCAGPITNQSHECACVCVSVVSSECVSASRLPGQRQSGLPALPVVGHGAGRAAVTSSLLNLNSRFLLILVSSVLELYCSSVVLALVSRPLFNGLVLLLD